MMYNTFKTRFDKKEFGDHQKKLLYRLHDDYFD